MSRNGSGIAFDFSSEAMNQLILRAAGEGIYGVNAEGKTTFVNPAAERMLGWKAEELVGHDMHSIVHHTHPDGSHYPEHDCPIYAAFRDGAVHQVDTEVFWRKDGTSFWVEYTSTPIRDGGHVVGAVIVFRDITQRREADEKLRAAHEEVDRLRERLELENAYLQEEIRIEGNHHGIVGRSAAIQKMLRQVELVAPTDATVLITGESGTGKELIARAIHDASKRSRRPLIRVNCATIPRELFESEFFGHAKGALRRRAARRRRPLRARRRRHAVPRRGRRHAALSSRGSSCACWRRAISSASARTQTRTVDVRVIAATNRDLKQEVRRGRFREDLYFRLDVFPIESVPLRERRDDIPLLAAHFVQGEGRKLKRELQADRGRRAPPDAIRLARQRARAGERDRARRDPGAPRAAAHRPAGGEAPRRRPRRRQADRLLTDDERRERDRANILAALESCGGKVFGRGGAAELLDVKPTTLASRIKALGITFEKPREKNGRGATAS